MKLIEGLEKAKETLSAQRSLGLDDVSEESMQRIEDIFGERLVPSDVVSRILDRVRVRGDEALRDLSLQIDRVELACLETSDAAVKAAYREVPRDLLDALEYAAERVRTFQQASMPRSWSNPEQGYGQKVVPVDRVGVYAPGGRAPYPSTVLMTAIPARVAGVREVILASPAGANGSPSASILVAADLAGVDRIFQIGGAQAMAAMAFGTESVPRVDMVCGPGNVFVTIAKKLLYGQVGIDGLYGPTETVLIADDTTDPAFCAADLLAQAEHDVMATPILVTTSARLVDCVESEIQRQLRTLDREEVARKSLNERGYIVLVDSLDETVEIANIFAPEHLCLLVEEPARLLAGVRNAGGVFVGQWSPEVMGDYTAGPSHTMPTGGTARFSSSLGVHNFLKYVPVVSLGKASFVEQAAAVSTIGRAEGFTAHARAAEVRMERINAGKRV